MSIRNRGFISTFETIPTPTSPVATIATPPKSGIFVLQGDDSKKKAYKPMDSCLFCILNFWVQILIFIATIFILQGLGLGIHFPKRVNLSPGVAVAIPGASVAAANPVLKGLVTSSKGAELAQGVTLKVEYSTGTEPNVIPLGPHKVVLAVDKSCATPSLWIRWEGAALVGINLVKEESADQWSGIFSMPVDGEYQLKAHWYGCGGTTGIPRQNLDIAAIAVKGPKVPLPKSSTPFFPEAAWIAPKMLLGAGQVNQQYLWFDPTKSVQKDDLMKTAASSIVSKSSTTTENGFYKIDWLGNYELVCFVGSDSAASIRENFLALKAIIAPYQRPFKFHYYLVRSFVKPDTLWDDGQKTAFRKCKQVFVSLDEPNEKVSQEEYKSQVQTFLQHLMKALDDDTFPIWMVTNMEAPEKPANCQTGGKVGMSSEHPCNVILKDLFRESPFPSRVRLLDNTDLTLPQLGENTKDIAAVVACRIFVLVGKTVQDWRNAGQRGIKQGLQKGGTPPDEFGQIGGGQVIPNPALVAYAGWN